MTRGAAQNITLLVATVELAGGLLFVFTDGSPMGLRTALGTLSLLSSALLVCLSLLYGAALGAEPVTMRGIGRPTKAPIDLTPGPTTVRHRSRPPQT